MPYLPNSQEFLEQSSLLLEAYPDTVRIFHSTLFARTTQQLLLHALAAHPTTLKTR